MALREEPIRCHFDVMADEVRDWSWDDRMNLGNRCAFIGGVNVLDEVRRLMHAIEEE